jgi:subtilase family serine protease
VASILFAVGDVFQKITSDFKRGKGAKLKNGERIIYFLGQTFFALVFSLNAGAQVSGTVRVQGHVPTVSIKNAVHMGRLAESKQISLTIALNLRNQAQLESVIKRLHDPSDPMFGKFLTSEQFSAQFGPTAQDVNEVAQYFAGQNLKVNSITSNTVKVSGASADIEKAFNLEMHQYQAQDGRIVFAPNADPAVSTAISSKIAGILGLNTFTNFKSHKRYRNPMGATPTTGTGPNGGLSPSDIQKAYSFSGGATNGSGQTLALMELDGYTPSDITQYVKQFALPSTPALQNILVDSYDGSAGDGADEVTLDIELMMAVAPGASKILVYEGVNSENGPLDVYTKIATDNLAKQVSTSWGSAESQNTAAFLNSENAVFMQMAAQGQSMYAAAGDAGAYDDGQSLSVDDPASQPYVVASGGTTLSVNADGSYNSESSWGIPAQGQNDAQGGGGGISSVWPIPSWQANIATAANQGSKTNRMVPDISVDANPQTGYAIYTSGQWEVIGGTSCAAPLLAAFTALVNQERTASGLAVLGFPNLALYQIAASNLYSTLFHDVNDQSTNLFYSAVSGYDLSTGWGSINATSLISALAGTGTSAGALSAPASLTVVPHNQVATLSWPATSGALSYTVSRAPSSGGPFTVVAKNISGTNYVDVGLQNGTTYFYEVAADNITSQSSDSAATAVTPTLMVPQAPGNLTLSLGGT